MTLAEWFSLATFLVLAAAIILNSASIRTLTKRVEAPERKQP